MAPNLLSRRWPWAGLPLLALLATGCPDGTGDFAPGGKAKEMIRPVDKNALAPVSRTDSDNGPDEEASPDLPPGHPGVGNSNADLLARVEAMKGRLEKAPKQLEVLVALGDLYFENQRYLDAIDWYRQAVALADPGWKKLDAVPAKARSARVPEPVKEACRRGAGTGFEALSAAAEDHARKREFGPAAYCWRQALDPALLAQARRGYAFLLAGNADQAIAEEEAVLRRDPSSVEALFYQGATLSQGAGADLAVLRRARASWQKVIELDPGGGNTSVVKEALARLDERIRNGGKPPAPGRKSGSAPDPGSIDSGAAEAIAQMDVSDPGFWKAAEAQIAEGEAHLAKGEYAQAREQIKGMLPVLMMKAENSPLLPRVLADMGIVYVQLGNRELGPRMLRMALDKDPKNPQAKAALEAIEKGAPLPRFLPPAR